MTNISKDFAKWKMALVQNNQPKYYSELNDHEQVVTSQFYAPTRDGVPLVQNRVWIGLGKCSTFWWGINCSDF